MVLVPSSIGAQGPYTASKPSRKLRVQGEVGRSIVHPNGRTFYHRQRARLSFFAGAGEQVFVRRATRVEPARGRQQTHRQRLWQGDFQEPFTKVLEGWGPSGERVAQLDLQVDGNAGAREDQYGVMLKLPQVQVSEHRNLTASIVFIGELLNDGFVGEGSFALSAPERGHPLAVFRRFSAGLLDEAQFQALHDLIKSDQSGHRWTDPNTNLRFSIEPLGARRQDHAVLTMPFEHDRSGYTFGRDGQLHFSGSITYLGVDEFDDSFDFAYDAVDGLPTH